MSFSTRLCSPLHETTPLPYLHRRFGCEIIRFWNNNRPMPKKLTRSNDRVIPCQRPWWKLVPALCSILFASFVDPLAVKHCTAIPTTIRRMRVVPWRERPRDGCTKIAKCHKSSGRSARRRLSFRKIRWIQSFVNCKRREWYGTIILRYHIWWLLVIHLSKYVPTTIGH